MSLTPGKVALVTGGSRGIGRAVALALAEAGARVAVNYRVGAEAAQAVVAEIKARGGQAVALPADVSQSQEASRLVQAAAAALGPIDILVNNAGITRDGLVMRLSEEDWDQVVDVNLKGAFLCVRAALPPMVRRRWGRIISIASVVGLSGNPGQANYAASKGGLVAFTRAVAREVASRRITVNAVAPGFIETEMTAALGEKRREAVQGQIPLGAFGAPEDVAQAVLFLASEEAGYITGQVLNVDGGLVMA